MTDARDSAKVVVQLAEIGKPGEAYNIASGKSHSIQELLDVAVGMASVDVETKIDTKRFRPYDEKDLVADIGKLQALTGWSPKHELKDSVETILEYWRRKIQYLYAHNETTTPKVSSQETSSFFSFATKLY